jgi:DtxR family Mn-dependent transcriptional regulator
MLTLAVAVAVLVAGIVLMRTHLGPRIRAARERRRRVAMEDALKHIYDAQHRAAPATVDSLSGALGLARGRAVDLIAAMERARLLRVTGDGLVLTPAGRSLALQVIRAHRIWERYLTDEVGTALADVHSLAEAQEHDLSVRQVDHLDARLGHPPYDPHGDPIPTGSGDLERRDAVPLVEWPLGRLARIVHVEDEPPSVFAQILSEGLVPGIDVEPLGADGKGLHLRTSTHECWLPTVVAAGIFVHPAPVEPEAEPLSALKPGERAVVLALRNTGLARRRFMDLGLTPGVLVRAEMTSAFGDPVAYRVRGTLIALRREQAAQVLVRRETVSKSPPREAVIPP